MVLANAIEIETVTVGTTEKKDELIPKNFPLFLFRAIIGLNLPFSFV